jgi:hypothetical protein
MQNRDTLSSPMKYEAIAVQDSRALWHRVVILGMIEKGTFLFNSLLFFLKKMLQLIYQGSVFIFVILVT